MRLVREAIIYKQIHLAWTNREPSDNVRCRQLLKKVRRNKSDRYRSVQYTFLFLWKIMESGRKNGDVAMFTCIMIVRVHICVKFFFV